jgi:sortase A
MAVLSLAVGIVLALLFTGYAVVYRMRVGPGMSAPPAIAQGPQLSTAPSPTVVTPAPLPTVTEPFAAPNATAPPTLIPEPTLPLPVRTPFGQSPKPTPTVRPPASSPPTRLTIPKIGLDIPVVQVGIKTVTSGGKSKTVWADVPNAGGFHQTSAYPGNPGNTVINGHRDILGSVFRHLDQVEVGDAIEIYVGDAVYPYLVSETLIVPETFASAEQRAENQRLIGYMPEERLTLVTCTPVGLATHRLLVIAEPPAQAAPQMSEAGSDDSP